MRKPNKIRVIVLGVDVYHNRIKIVTEDLQFYWADFGIFENDIIKIDYIVPAVLRTLEALYVYG